MKNPQLVVTPGQKISLKEYNSAHTGDFKVKEDVAAKFASDIAEIAQLQEILYASGQRAILIILQGMDTSGKDGVIKHVMTGVNPQGCEVHSFKTPSAEELIHDYLWRHVKVLPARGRIGIFNRSYYEETIVLRVHPEMLQAQGIDPALAKKSFWQQRFNEINNFEQFLTQNGVTVLKFFLYIDKKEQQRRLLKRIDDKTKHWKFSVSDATERRFFDEYMTAYEEVFNHTSTDAAPWYVIPADQKWFAHMCVANVLLETLRSLHLAYPIPTPAEHARIEAARKILA